MKTIKISVLIMSMIAALVACDPTDMVTYPARSDEAFFEDDSYTYAAAAGETTYTVTVSRANKEGVVSVPVTLTVENTQVAEAFSAPASVQFADGENYAEYTITYDLIKLKPGESNAMTLTLDSTTDLPYSTSCSVIIVRDYEWIDYANGAYDDGYGPWEVIMQHAKDTDIYRLKDWYAEDSGYHLEFKWDGSSTISFLDEPDGYGEVRFTTGYLYQGSVRT